MVFAKSDATFHRFMIIAAGVAASFPCYRSQAVEALMLQISEDRQTQKPNLRDVNALCYEEFTDDQAADLLSRLPHSTRPTVEPLELPVR